MIVRDKVKRKHKKNNLQKKLCVFTWSFRNKIVFLLYDLNYNSIGRGFVNCRLVRFMFDQFFLGRKINMTLIVPHLLHNPAGSLRALSVVLPLSALWWMLRETACFEKVVRHRSWTCWHYCFIWDVFALSQKIPVMYRFSKQKRIVNLICLMDFGGGGAVGYDSTREKLCCKMRCLKTKHVLIAWHLSLLVRVAEKGDVTTRFPAPFQNLAPSLRVFCFARETMRPKSLLTLRFSQIPASLSQLNWTVMFDVSDRKFWQKRDE